MKCHREVKGREALYQKLEARLQQEKLWAPNKRRFLSLGNGEVTFMERDHAVRGVLNLSKTFNMFPETYAMAVNFMDRFLALLKVRSTHLHCVSLSCIYIAIKLQEEQQYIPDVPALMESSVKTELGPAHYTQSDLLRMERKVLDKLEWDLNPVNPLTMLELYFAIACVEGCLLPEENPNEDLTMLTEQLELALTYSSVAMHTPTIIALSVISMRLCDSAVWAEKLLPQFLELSKSCHEDYYNCEELMEDLLYSMATCDMDSNLNNIALYKRSHGVTFAATSLSSSSVEDDIGPPPSKKPTYAAVLQRSLSESMMSMSL